MTDKFGASPFTAGSEGSTDRLTFDSSGYAAEKAGLSRIYGGIHFRYDSDAGLSAGADVGRYVLDNLLMPRDGGRRTAGRGPAVVGCGPRGVRYPVGMADVTQVLSAAAAGDPKAADELLPLVYAELRKLAGAWMAGEKPGHTLQPTALVHEAYLRLVSPDPTHQWNGRTHFFAVAARAMRRILIESARRKALAPRIALDHLEPTADDDRRLVELHDALERLAATEPVAAQIVEARVFAGLSVDEAAAALGLSRATAYREWTFARAWLATALGGESSKI